MKQILILLLIVTGICESQTISACSKNDFFKAIESSHLIKDKSNKVNKNKIILSKKYILNNNLSDDDFYNYKYLGNIGISLNYVVIEKQDYNGSTFFIIDKKNKFKKIDIQGKPYLFDDLIIAVNIESTTDNHNILNLYKIGQGIDFLKKINLDEDIIVKDIRLLNSEIYIGDLNDKFWKIKW